MYELRINQASQIASQLLHHDAITGTHSLTAKRDYDERIQMAEKILTNIDKFLIDDLDQLFKPVYGPTKLEEIANKLINLQ